MKRRSPPSPASLLLISKAIPQHAIAEAIGLKRRAIGYQLDGVNKMRPETLIAIRAIGGPEVADEVERLAYESWTELHPKRVPA